MIYKEAANRRKGGRGTVEARKRRRMQPTLLALEDRRLLSTYTVNSIGDSGTGSGLVGDLRYCITQANSAGGNETITFDSTVFNTPQTITLNGTQLELSDTTGAETITGPAAGVTVNGNNASRVFQIDGGVTASISRMTITGGSAGNGGGLANYGTATLTKSTISSNSASFYGGGINTNHGTLALTNCTVSGNSDGQNGGGIANYATATLGNTIVAGNTAGTGPDVYGGVASQGNNLIGKTDGSSGWVGSDLTGTIANPLNPLLAPLGNYGGPTQTVALLPGSLAIDAGSNALIPAGVTTDQRGLPRIVNTVADIGAFESSGFTIAVTSGGGQSTGVLTAFPAPLVATVTANDSLELVAGGLVTFTAPSSGASVTLSGSPATISTGGTASVTATANGITGSYAVTATASGITTPASFNLTNLQLIIALDPSTSGALSLSGNASINIPGIVYVDSSSTSALSASGNAQVKAAAIDVVGGVKKTGNASLSPAPVTGTPVQAVASLPLPSTTGMTNYGSFSLGGNSSKTIPPGIYSSISVSGNAKLTMASSIYIIEGGGFSVSGNASVTGSGVMIVNAGSKYPATGGTYGNITLGGNSVSSFSPATSGIYAGIVFFQPLDNTKTMTVTGNASGISGSTYAPGARAFGER